VQGQRLEAEASQLLSEAIRLALGVHEHNRLRLRLNENIQ
jgi:hypothetical protein